MMQNNLVEIIAEKVAERVMKKPVIRELKQLIAERVKRE